MSAEPPPLRATSLHDAVAARLRAMVFERQLGPGQWVDEKALAAAWQISRTPLREALKVLAAEGLVDLVPQRGCRVVELTDADALQLFPVMALLEGRCAHEAALNITPHALAELQTLHDALERHAAAADLDGYYRANHAFHARVQALADNRWLDRATGDLRRFMRLWRGRQLALPGRMAQSLAEHRALMAALQAGDAAAAERAMRDHLMAQLLALQHLQHLERHGPGTAAAAAASRAAAPKAPPQAPPNAAPARRTPPAARRTAPVATSRTRGTADVR
jgi:DNA-binding GntR family transcriptional regulator